MLECGLGCGEASLTMGDGSGSGILGVYVIGWRINNGPSSSPAEEAADSFSSLGGSFFASFLGSFGDSFGVPSYTVGDSVGSSSAAGTGMTESEGVDDCRRLMRGGSRGVDPGRGKSLSVSTSGSRILGG